MRTLPAWLTTLGLLLLLAWPAAAAKPSDVFKKTPISPFGCGSGETWSPREGRCLPSTWVTDAAQPPKCPEGQEWSPSARRCLDKAPSQPICPPGQRWSPAWGRCVPLKGRVPMGPTPAKPATGN